jgi:hypothetical protein
LSSVFKTSDVHVHGDLNRDVILLVGVRTIKLVFILMKRCIKLI